MYTCFHTDIFCFTICVNFPKDCYYFIYFHYGIIIIHLSSFIKVVSVISVDIDS